MIEGILVLWFVLTLFIPFIKNKFTFGYIGLATNFRSSLAPCHMAMVARSGLKNLRCLLATYAFIFDKWYKMSLATLVGGVIAYPMNRWLVKRGLKHGMMSSEMSAGHSMEHGEGMRPRRTTLFWTVVLSLVILVLGCLVATL